MAKKRAGYGDLDISELLPVFGGTFCAEFGTKL